MDRASDSGSEGWGFESLPAYQGKIIRTLSQQGKGFGLFLYLGLEQKMQMSGGHLLGGGSTMPTPSCCESLPAYQAAQIRI